MPRRQQQFGKPLRRRGKAPSAPSMPVTLKGRHAKALTRELIKANQQPNKTAAQNDALARTGAWRFRRHLAPFGWLAFLLLAGAILPATTHPLLFGIIAGIAGPVLLVLFTRHLPRFAKRAAGVAAMLTSLWLPFLAAMGLRACLPALLITWAICTGLWVRHYRWRPAAPEKAAEPRTDDPAVWERLAARRKWVGKLADPEPTPDGGRKWQIQLDGIETHIGQVMSEPRALAAAWHKARTEVYVEPHPTGVESRGVLTILKAGTLETIRDWDGHGISENGTAVIGRFADAQPAHIRFFVRRDGTRHGLIAGATGAGKSALLDLICYLAVTSKVPIVPIILDPQNGQSLPQWQDKVLYAAGVDECLAMLRGIHAGLLSRSRYLARMTWTDRSGHTNRGLPFYDHDLTGLPIILIIIDEAPVMLTANGNFKLAAEAIRLIGEIAKLGRKTGVSLWPVAQVPSLAELGDQVVRSMLVGGNVVCLRTGDRVSAGMLGLEADPASLPKYFPNREPTGGLGYVAGPDNRQAPMRVDLVPESMRRDEAVIPELDERFAAALSAAMGTQGVLPIGAPEAAPEPQPTAEAEPDGRRCADAVWKILDDSGSDMDRGVIIADAGVLATTEWGRAKPFTVGAVRDALRDLVDGKHPGRKVIKPAGAKPGVYRAVPAGQEQEQGAA